MKSNRHNVNPRLLAARPEHPGQKKALIIDDETDTCYLLSSILEQKDIQAAFAGNLAEADKILHSGNSFLFIFLDNHLPDGLGINYIGGWKKKYPQTSLIMISAHDSDEFIEKAHLDGADLFIGKPFSKDLILKTVDTFSQ